MLFFSVGFFHLDPSASIYFPGFFLILVFMNETNSLRIPHPYQVLPPSPHLPQPHQLSPLYAVQQASLFNMLAYEAAATGVSPHNNYNYHSLSPTSPMVSY